MPGVDPLVLESVTKCFGRSQTAVQALRQVSMTVRSGEFLAVMGASGSGKSTLLHLMAALTMPDEGRILISGKDPARMSDRALTDFRRTHIGLVFQTFNLIPTLTALENVSLPLRLGGETGPEVLQRVTQVLEKLGLGHRKQHRPDALSGGEQQRVAVARALVTRPAVILADEPTGNLDAASSATICDLLRNLNEQEGVTIVMVTHEPSVAMHAREVAYLSDGRLVGRFSTKELRGVAELSERYQALRLEAAAQAGAAAIGAQP